MSFQMFLLLLFALVVGVYIGLALRAYLRLRGKRIVVCPETNKPAAVSVDAAHAAVNAMWETSDIRLATCSRWPEREDCNQACTPQIASAPEDTLVTSMLKRWYAGKDCAICRRPIGPIRPAEPTPGLLNVASPTHETIDWKEIPAEQLPALLDTHLPVCANCHVAETFRRQFPDLVVNRAETSKRDISVH